MVAAISFQWSSCFRLTDWCFHSMQQSQLERLAWPGAMDSAYRWWVMCCNERWTPRGLELGPRRTSSQLKPIHLHRGSLALICRAQNKASQSNLEKRWVGTMEGRKKRDGGRGGMEGEQEHFCVYESEWAGDKALQQQSYELWGPWLVLWGVYVSKIQPVLLSLKYCFFLIPLFNLPL